MEPDMCRKGLHDRHVTGITADGRCLMCRRIRNSRAVRRYTSSPKGRLVNRAGVRRYKATPKGLITQALWGLRRRRRAHIALIQSLEEEFAS